MTPEDFEARVARIKAKLEAEREAKATKVAITRINRERKVARLTAPKARVAVSDDILLKAILEGQRTVTEFKASTQLSRVTVRQALVRLELKGLVKRGPTRQRKGVGRPEFTYHPVAVPAVAEAG